MNEGDTYGLYLRDTLFLVASLDLAALVVYLRHRWKRSRLLASQTPDPAQ
jgi:hypothetical protein